MCGIAGICDLRCPSLKSAIRDMRDVMTHRGPDSFGSVVFPQEGVALGHRRLSILDLSDLGAQPMTDQTGNLVIVHNGEVYNFIEIRVELESAGYVFRSHTDTEVILAAYDKWGTSCLERFNGMFSFAIWNKQRKEVFLARDRLGIKPLYYYIKDDVFVFASEVKAILTYLEDRPGINTSAVDAYMSFGYVPGEETMFKGIKRLLPGHYIIRTSNGCVCNRMYWDFYFKNSEDRGIVFYQEELERLLNNSIDLRLRSDVPLGIFLSGGLDSSAVVALLASRVTEPLKTFSVAYDFGSQFNETPYARQVAEKFNTDHHEIFITPDDFRDFIPRFIHLMDEPVAESAAISLYFVSKLAKEKVTVVLSGEGSDEIFAGYDLYQYMAVLEKYFRISGKTITAILAGVGDFLLPAGNKFAKYLTLGAMPLEQRYKGISTYEERYKKRLYNDAFSSACKEQKDDAVKRFLTGLFKQTQNNDVLSRMLYFDTKTWLVDDLLIKADRMSMAASLELRVPFLDYRLVEFAASMPAKYKVRNGQGKYLLKKMMEDVLPKDIVYRKKMGFPTPLKMMFEGELYGYAQDVLLSISAKNSAYFSRERIEEILREHKSKKMDHHRFIWQLIVLEQWLSVNQDKELMPLGDGNENSCH